MIDLALDEDFVATGLIWLGHFRTKLLRQEVVWETKRLFVLRPPCLDRPLVLEALLRSPLGVGLPMLVVSLFAYLLLDVLFLIYTNALVR